MSGIAAGARKPATDEHPVNATANPCFDKNSFLPLLVRVYLSPLEDVPVRQRSAETYDAVCIITGKSKRHFPNLLYLNYSNHTIAQKRRTILFQRQTPRTARKEGEKDAWQAIKSPPPGL